MAIYVRGCTPLEQLGVKGLVHPKMKIKSLITHKFGSKLNN